MMANANRWTRMIVQSQPVDYSAVKTLWALRCRYNRKPGARNNSAEWQPRENRRRNEVRADCRGAIRGNNPVSVRVGRQAWPDPPFRSGHELVMTSQRQWQAFGGRDVAGNHDAAFA
jgi:hypothetical protein